MKTTIEIILNQLGTPCHILGYDQIVTATLYMKDNPHSRLTKEVYPHVAAIHNSKPARVERAIRHAVEITFLQGDYTRIQELFGSTYSVEKGKPCNALFLQTVMREAKRRKGE